MVNNVFSQQATTVLPNNASYSNRSGPQGALRYQREFYLVTPAEMSNSGISSGMNINSIGFTIGRAQNDTTKGQFRVYLQNTTDLASRADTGWNTLAAATNEFDAAGLFPGRYEWQVRANCSGSSAFTPSVFFINDELDGCNNPYNLNAVSVTTTTATLAWEAATSLTFVEYLVEYKDIDSVNWIAATTTATTLNISGLNPGKSYQWRVKTVCTTNFSPINSSSFLTNPLSNCNPPTGLSSSVTNDSLVTFSWNGAVDALYYQVQFRRKGTSSWSTTSSFTNSANLVLTAGTTYEWQVRTICNPGPSGNFVPGTDFAMGGLAVCYEPINPTTRNITSTSAKLTWTPVVGATGYTIRYRLKNTITWVNAVTPMTLASSGVITIPDTIGAYDIPFTGGGPFTYTGGGLYIAWEYSRPAGTLSTANLTLSTTSGTRLAGANGQDSLTFLLCMVSRADTNFTGQPAILGESNQRPETRLGSSSLKDSVAVVAVYALGMTTPKFQSPATIAAVITNKSATNKNYNVTLTVKEQQSNAVRYTTTQNITVTATDTALVVFNGWSPTLLEKDSIIISIPAEPNENVINNNSKSYFQNVNASVLAYDDGTSLVSAAGFGTAAGLLLNKHTIKGCGQVLAAKVFLTESAKNMPVYAVIRNTAGVIVAQSPAFTAGESDINSYHSFYFTNPVSFLNEDFYIGIAQAASATPYYPVGAQWEDATTRAGAYYQSNLDGSGLSDHPAAGRLMIRAEIVSSVPEPYISGNLTLCNGGSNILTAGSVSTRYANSIIGYSSQYASTNYSAVQALGSPNVYPTHALSANAWMSATANDQREYLVLGFANPGKINFVDIYETANPGAVDSVFAKNPVTLNYELLYSTTATAAPLTARKNRISFTETAFDVSEIRIALNSPAVAGYNSIDAVGIGKTILPGIFSSYSWNPGGETTQTKIVTTSGIHTLTVTNGNGCQSAASVTVVDAITTAPVITAGGPTSFCPGDSVVLTSSLTTGITWNTGATTASITVHNAGSYRVTYDDGSGCGALTSAPVTVSINPVPTVTISGSLNICLGNQNLLNAGAGYSSYLWSTGQTTQTILISTEGIYSVTVSNSFGCKNSASVTAVYATLPSPVITGNLSFCTGGYTVLNAGAGYSSYLWSTGATTQTITVTTIGDYDVTVTNAGGCSASAAVVVTLFTSPVPTISGNAGFCAGSSTTLTANAGYTAYSWSTGATTPTITVNSTGTYTVTVTDGNSCTGSKSISITAFPNPTPVISGSLSFCGGTSTILNAGSGYSSYLWSTGATTQTITVNSIATYTVSVTNSFGCSGSASATTNNTGNLPATPGPITGPPNASCNTTGNIYSIVPVPNTTHYVWRVPTGVTLVSGQGTTSISVDFGAGFRGGNIIVAASNICGQSQSLNPRFLFIKALPGQPGAITGQIADVCGSVTKTYSVPAAPLAIFYTWTVPGGASIISGQGTTSVNVSFPAGFMLGNICVTSSNSCGTSAATCAIISGILQTPGPINGPTSVCKKAENLFYSISPVNNATSYTWTVPKNADITAGQGTRTILVNMENYSGNITVKANGACGSSGTSSLAITVTNCYAENQEYTMEQIRPVPEVVSSYGGAAKAGNIYFEWTVGEPRVESVKKPGYLFTQGFHQPFIHFIKRADTILLSTDKLKIIVYPNPVNTVLKVSVETTDNKPLVLELVDVYSRLLQRKHITAGLKYNLAEFNMAGYSGGSYYLIVRDTKGNIINTFKLVKVN